MLGHQPDDDVAQFANVAREGIVFPAGLRLRRQGECRAVALFGVDMTEVIEQQEAVGPPVPQRRHGDGGL